MNDTEAHQMTFPFVWWGTQLEFEFMRKLPRAWPCKVAGQKVRVIDLSCLSDEERAEIFEEISHGSSDC